MSVETTETDPGWVINLGRDMREAQSAVERENGRRYPDPPKVWGMAEAAEAVALGYLRSLHDQVEALKCEEESHAKELRGALNERNAYREETDRLRASQAELTVEYFRRIDVLMEGVRALKTHNDEMAQRVAEVNLKADLVAGVEAVKEYDDYKSERWEAGPEMRQVSDLQDGDAITGIWSRHAPRPGKGGLPFAESGMGWLTDVVTTRAVTPLPDKPGAVIEAEDGIIGTGPREKIVAELFAGRWHSTTGNTYEPNEIRLISVLRDGREGGR